MLTCLTLPVGNGINPPTVRWTFNTGNVVGGIVSKPVIVDGIVYVGSYGHNNIHAVATDATGADGNGGTEVWSYSTGAVAVKADPVIYRGNLCVTSRLCLCAPPPFLSGYSDPTCAADALKVDNVPSSTHLSTVAECADKALTPRSMTSHPIPLHPMTSCHTRRRHKIRGRCRRKVLLPQCTDRGFDVVGPDGTEHQRTELRALAGNLQ